LRNDAGIPDHFAPAHHVLANDALELLRLATTALL
jgi:hypothetical protein